MHNQKFVFAQIVAFLDIDKFRYIVQTNEGDKYVKHFSCWNQLLALMLGQLSARNSMRDLINLLNTHPKKLYHLGVGKRVPLSNLSKANEQRSSLIFKKYAVFMISIASQIQVKDVLHLEGHIYAFDSSTIDLCLNLLIGQSSVLPRVASSCTCYTMLSCKYQRSSLSQMRKDMIAR